jgi:hypothetical protein
MRLIKWSVLAVGEGDSEKAFLDHLKAKYISRNCGVALAIKQAYGKGARNVVHQAIRYAKDVSYDRIIALADTDTDYDSEVLKTAEENRVLLLPSDPCFEGLLLRLHGDEKERSSAGHKAEFEARFGGRVQDPDVLDEHFNKEFLEEIRDRNALIHQLINTLGIKREPRF